MKFQQKSGFVARCHTEQAPNSIIYYSVISRDSIIIGFLLVSLHEVDITTIDPENAYLNEPCVEKIWFVGGDEYG